MTLSTSELCANFQQIVCSRPPFPTTIIFIIIFYPKRKKGGSNSPYVYTLNSSIFLEILSTAEDISSANT